MSKSFPKIAFFALESYSLVGGLQQFNRRVVSALSELSQKHNGIKPVIILKGDKPEHVKERPEHVVFKACGESRVVIAREILEALSADIIFLGHVNLLPMTFFIKLLRPRIKIILFVHGVDVWGSQGRKIKKLDRFFIKFVDQIASVSSFTAQKMSESFIVPKDKFLIFPNAVDPLDIKDAGNCSLNKAPMLLTVARLSENEKGKHHDSVLKALPTVIQAVPHVKYRIIGDGVLRKELEDIAVSLGVSHAVEFKGRVSDEDLAKSYEEASIFVMPSEKEGFGIVFLEAWLRKIPVICGTEDASHEVVSHGEDGFAIHHDDIDQLAEKIIYLLSNPDNARAMGQLGEKKVKEKYLMPNFTTNLFNLLSHKGLG